MQIRRFLLENEKGQRFRLDNLNEGCFLISPSDLGYSYNINFTQVGFDFIEEQDKKLTKLLVEGMKKIPHINLVGPKNADERAGIVTFTIDGVHPHDIASLLSDENIAIRAGHHCAQPLGQYLGIQSSARASVYFCNTEKEIQTFLEKLAQVRKWSGYKD